MLIVILAILIFLSFTTWNTYSQEVNVLRYKSQYFYVSGVQSKRMFDTMSKDPKITLDSIKNFVMLEDRLLKLEKTSVCTGVSHEHEAFTLSDTIKEMFLAYDFSYHTIHLKQVAEPNKLINRSITC